MKKKLYRLKSNPKTIVESDGKWSKVFWAESMFSMYDARWMMHGFNAENSLPLTEEEEKEIRGYLKEFLDKKAFGEENIPYKKRRR